jgi:hypothetical protein
MKGVKGDYPIRRALARQGYTLVAAARELGILKSSLSQWAEKNGVTFAPRLAPPAPPLRPLSNPWFAARLTAAERADYRVLRKHGGQTVIEALTALQRADLVAEITGQTITGQTITGQETTGNPAQPQKVAA